MCERLLSDTLKGVTPVNSLLNWLVCSTNEDTNTQELEAYKCFQSDFILFFLNYIHQTQSFSEKNCDISNYPSTSKCLDLAVHIGDSSLEKEHSILENVNHFEKGQENFVHSTPILVRNNLDRSYASPLSPLYNQQNFMSKERSNGHNTRTTPTLCLGDFIVSRSNSRRKVQRNLSANKAFAVDDSPKTRRINPTSLNREYKNANFRKSDNSFTFNKSMSDEIVDTSNGQRSFLVEERMKVMSKMFDSSPPTLAVSKALISRMSEIVPLVSSVTFRQQLDILINIYICILDNNYVLNFTAELCFLITLLSSREYHKKDDGNLDILSLCDDRNFTNTSFLNSIHNRVYFACHAFQSQIGILKVLDRPTLRLLVDNRCLKQFTSSMFQSSLFSVYEQKSEKAPERSNMKIQRNVCFISDTDNKDNFPDAPSFHAFRKQRDLFYETLRIWENNRFQNEWNFSVALGGKIKALLNMHLEAANLIHFARLFKSQLLMNTCGNNDDDCAENELSFFPSIPNIDSEKLLRLKNRIVSKQATSGINAVPTFNGHQEFYRDFLLVAANHMFNRHLSDALIKEIVALDNTKFSCSDLDDAAATIDSATQSSYALCVKSLRILAKFLGFLESLPYVSRCSQLPQNIVSNQLHIRDQVQPGLDVKMILKSCVQNNSLSLTVPWITKYLAMLDYITLRIPYYQRIFNMLFEIYLSSSDKPHIIKLCLGWLFELPHFPEDSYYMWLLQKFNSKQLKVLPSHNKPSNNALDKLDIVDQNLLYFCCPYLHEIKKILSNNASTANNSIKHITPLTAVQPSTNLLNKRLQLQLEEVFFNGQPISIRKTVEFVSERVASAFVKEICNEIVPPFKKMSMLELQKLLKSLSDTTDSKYEQIKSGNGEINKLTTTLIADLRKLIDDKWQLFSSARISTAIKALLATDVLEQTKDVCVSISTRTCHERIQQWTNSHITLGVISKDFDAEIKNWLCVPNRSVKTKHPFALPQFGKDIPHNPLAMSGVKIVESIRECSWRILEQPDDLSQDTILNLLGSVHQSIKQRCDLNDCILILICKMLVDMALLLIAHRHDIIDAKTVTRHFCVVWSENEDNYVNDLFKNLVCPRNVTLLSHSSTVELAWKSFGDFISLLLEERLLRRDVLEAQVVALDTEQFDEITLHRLSVTLRRIVDTCVNGGRGEGNDFVLLLSFLNGL